ncbi:hypothetical protein VY732_14575 [Pseudomonas sp. ZY71]|uniref:hypothetical protein n=1 Tax=Pseudomonas sp. ZY71 TaxID=3115647 RepID=UPI002F40E6D1
MIISISDNWSDARAQHDVFLQAIIDRHKKKLSKRCGPPTLTYSFLVEVESLLLSTQQADLISSIDIFLDYKKRAGSFQVQFIANLQSIFNYKTFTEKKDGWDAYKLCQKSKIKVCPYCHQVDIITVVDEKTKKAYRPPLDHFYYKNEYPHLALTLSNLVPSCTPCNTNLKAVSDFYLNPHLHPLYDDEKIEFGLHHPFANAYLLDILGSDPESVTISVDTTTPGCAATRRSLETFVMAERYKQSSTMAVEYAKSKLDWENLRLNLQINLMTTDEKTLTRFDRKTYRSRPLGKLFADIHDLINRLN